MSELKAIGGRLSELELKVPLLESRLPAVSVRNWRAHIACSAIKLVLALIVYSIEYLLITDDRPRLWPLATLLTCAHILHKLVDEYGNKKWTVIA